MRIARDDDDEEDASVRLIESRVACFLCTYIRGDRERRRAVKLARKCRLAKNPELDVVDSDRTKGDNGKRGTKVREMGEGMMIRRTGKSRVKDKIPDA